MENLIKSVEFWLPYIEGHFEGRSDEFDAEIDKIKENLKNAKDE